MKGRAFLIRTYRRDPSGSSHSHQDVYSDLRRVWIRCLYPLPFPYRALCCDSCWLIPSAAHAATINTRGSRHRHKEDKTQDQSWEWETGNGRRERAQSYFSQRSLKTRASGPRRRRRYHIKQSWRACQPARSGNRLDSLRLPARPSSRERLISAFRLSQSTLRGCRFEFPDFPAREHRHRLHRGSRVSRGPPLLEDERSVFKVLNAEDRKTERRRCKRGK